MNISIKNAEGPGGMAPWRVQQAAAEVKEQSSLWGMGQSPIEPFGSRIKCVKVAWGSSLTTKKDVLY